jgi:hypothetical protein
MVKKLFALASVTALTGLVAATGAAGCSSTTETTTGGNDAATTPDAKKTPPSTGTDGGDGEPTDEPTCVSKDPIDATKYSYTKSVNKPGACSTTEFDALINYIKNLGQGADVKIADWQATVGKDCADCVFTDVGASEWGTFLIDKGEFAGMNSGGCIEIVSKNADCGKAYQQVNECRLDACYNNTCKTQEDVDACLKDGAAIFDDPGPCKAAFEAVKTVCGKNLNAYETACQGATYTWDGKAKVQCVTGGAANQGDAGDDAGNN